MLSSLRKQGPITTGGWASRKVSLQPAIRKDTEYGSPRLCAIAHKAGTTNTSALALGAADRALGDQRFDLALRVAELAEHL